MTESFLYPLLLNEIEGVYTGFTLSVFCGQNCVCSVSYTILDGSVSYLHILSSYFRCVACNFFFKIQIFEVLANSLNLQLWLCLVLTWDPIWVNSMGNHGAAGVFSEHGILVVLVFVCFFLIFSSFVCHESNIFCKKLVQHSEHLVSNVDTDGLASSRHSDD